MPTIIALDCSLSMSRMLRVPDFQSNENKGSSSKISQKHIAQRVCLNLLNYLSSKLKLECVALLSFSSTCERLSGFTTDHGSLQTCLNKTEVKDKACLDPLFHEIDELVRNEYGFMVPCHIIIITDGRLHWPADLDTAGSTTRTSISPHFQFNTFIHFLSIVPRHELVKSGREEIMKKIIKANHGKGTIDALELASHASNVDLAVNSLVSDFTSSHMKVFTGTLQCGKLKNEIVLFPCPEAQEVPGDAAVKEFRTVNKDLQIVGFLDISNVINPPVLSRHLILHIENDYIASNDRNEPSSDLGSHPSFISALHGSLKVENKVALVSVGEDWYGIVGSWTDHRKKSSLILSLFNLGVDSMPWLGVIDQLGPLEGAPPPVNEKKGHFGNVSQACDTKSYAQNLVVWTRPTGLQTDVQKLLRSAKKLPEKTQVFYKDLNRLRKAALAFGFYELLEGVASILERECTMLPGTSHPEAALQLSHAAQELRSVKGYDVSITPLKTDFKYHSRS